MGGVKKKLIFKEVDNNYIINICFLKIYKANTSN